MTSSTLSRTRKAAATAGVVAALAVAGTGVAEAYQSGGLGPNGSQTYATYFWGKTQVCFRNVGSQDGSVYWESSTSHGFVALAKGSNEWCMARSFTGFRIYVQNTSANTTIAVRFPIGP